MNETKQALEAVVGLVGKWRNLALDRNNDLGEYYKQALDAAADELEAEMPELTQALEDARRYRWVVGYGGSNDTAEDDEAWDTLTNGGPKERIDAAIDALTAGEQA